LPQTRYVGILSAYSQTQQFGKYTVGQTASYVAGAGNGPRLNRLASDMLANQSNYTPEEAGFMAAFQAFQPTHYTNATSGTSVATSVPRLTQGTFLVAVPEMNGSPAKLFELDFAQGTRRDLPLNVAAQGTNPQLFLQIAQRAVVTHSAAAGLAGDLWAGDCVNQAIAAYSQAVGLPFDVFVTGPSGSGGWLAHHQRFAAVPSSATAAFLAS
jgi:hypothetical protein